MGENFRESSKKTNFAKKTFANCPKEFLTGRKLPRIGKAAIVYVAITHMLTHWKLSCEGIVPISSSGNSPYLLVCSCNRRV